LQIKEIITMASIKSKDKLSSSISMGSVGFIEPINFEEEVL